MWPWDEEEQEEFKGCTSVEKQKGRWTQDKDFCHSQAQFFIFSSTCYQLKVACCNYKMFYFMATTKQNLQYTQKNKKQGMKVYLEKLTSLQRKTGRKE